MQAEVEKPWVKAAGGHRTSFTRFPAEGRSMPGDHRARAAADELTRAADPCRGQIPHSAARKTAAGGRHSTRQGVTPTTLKPQIQCRGTHRQGWLTPIHRAATAVIADIRHIHNRTGPYGTFRGYGQGQALRYSGHREARCETARCHMIDSSS